MKMKNNTKHDLYTYGIVIVTYTIICIFKSAGLLSYSLSGQLIPVCSYIIMALSLNLTVGVLGELSLGHAGFMSIGAFTGAVLSMSMTTFIESGFLRLIISIVAGGAIAGLFGFLIGIPVLRLNGDYLAIVTLAFGEIIKSIINCLYIGFDTHGIHFSLRGAANLGLDEGGKIIINGPVGAIGIQKISTFTVGFAMIMITLFIIFNLTDSRAGRAIMALRDNSIAAESVGISVIEYKMTAFVISAFLAGTAGALYSLNFYTVTASKFNFNTSILILVFVVLGGIGNMRGSIIAAVLLTILPEILRGFTSYRMLIYAVILITVMIVKNNETFKNYVKSLASKCYRKIRRNMKTESGERGSVQ